MRIGVVIDGDLLIPQDPSLGISGQRKEIEKVAEALGELCVENQVLIIHGNASQIGFVLLRSEASSHLVHPIPLDVCGADTQGATGYLLEQALHNWLRAHQVSREVAMVLTQVVVVPEGQVEQYPKRGIGPYFDAEKAQYYANTRRWDFQVTPGLGYRRVVPAFQPQSVVEINSIRTLLEAGALVICGGGGGVPVCQAERGGLVGTEGLVDKSLTASLLCQELQADLLVFLCHPACLDQLAQVKLPYPCRVSGSILPGLLACGNLPEDLENKLRASQGFLEAGGHLALLVTLSGMNADFQHWNGVYFESN